MDGYLLSPELKAQIEDLIREQVNRVVTQQPPRARWTKRGGQDIYSFIQFRYTCSETDGLVEWWSQVDLYPNGVANYSEWTDSSVESPPI